MDKSNFSRLNMLLVIIGILIIFSGCLEQQPVPITPTPPTITPTPTPTPAPTTTLTPTITISSPTEGDQVSLRHIVEGTSAGVYGSNLKIYVLVYPIEVGRWWVQPDVNILPNGNWDTNVYFGDPANPSKDIGKKFRISVIATSVKLKEGEQLENIPDNAYRVDIKEVVRR
jgi:hypothetical protein